MVALTMRVALMTELMAGDVPSKVAVALLWRAVARRGMRKLHRSHSRAWHFPALVPPSHAKSALVRARTRAHAC
eukprot:2454857-Alexandrium_andersonii.AAC.1